MPHSIVLSGQADFDGWRAAARRLCLAGISPEKVGWSLDDAPDLFAGVTPLPDVSGAFNVPRRFVDLASEAILHSDPERFALLYRLLWRLRDEPSLLDLTIDRDVSRANDMAKNVRRDIHKMHAFVRFREIKGEERFVAWFVPEHHTLEARCAVLRAAFSEHAVVDPQPACRRALEWDGTDICQGGGATGCPGQRPTGGYLAYLLCRDLQSGAAQGLGHDVGNAEEVLAELAGGGID